jgi:hypothetical protein
MYAFRISAPDAYAYALLLYPRAFRERYATQMMDAARIEFEQSANFSRTCRDLMFDLIKSVPREHWRAATPANPVYAAAFALFFSAVLLTVSVAYQQALRRGADRQPLSLVDSMNDRVTQGADPVRLAGTPSREIASAAWLNSSNFFAVVYNDAGHPIAGNATLHGVLPQPPTGIFRYARAHGLNKVSWQPGAGIRVATVIKPLPTGGFVLAGQSLIVSETQESRLNRLLTWIWLTMLAAVAGIGFLTHLRHHAKPE